MIEKDYVAKDKLIEFIEGPLLNRIKAEEMVDGAQYTYSRTPEDIGCDHNLFEWVTLEVKYRRLLKERPPVKYPYGF